jgi:hypothetical protein
MEQDNRLLLIAGSGRNTGKTTLATSIINNLSANYSITGLKVCTKRTGDERHHGAHEDIPSDSFSIYRETGTDPHKDTAKMMIAGAGKAFFIIADKSKLLETYNAIRKFAINDNTYIVCESGSLRKHVKPGLFLFVQNDHGSKSFEGSPEPGVDVIINTTDNIEIIQTIANRVSIKGESWILLPE